MRARFWIAAALALPLTVAPVLAQQAAPAASGPAAAVRPVPSVDAIFARLRAMAEAMRTFEPAKGVAEAHLGLISRGALLAGLPVRYQRVGYLEAPLVRNAASGAAGNVLPANMPVFATRFAGGDARRVEAWCGVAPEGRRQRPAGYCLLDMGGPALGVVANDGSPYMPRSLSSWAPAAPVAVRQDARAQAALPRLELTYVFTEFDARDVDVMTGVRVNGGAIVSNYNVSLPREADGSAVLHVGGGALRLRPGATRRDAMVEQIAPVIAYNPQADEAELRVLAQRIHDRMAAQAATAPATP